MYILSMRDVSQNVTPFYCIRPILLLLGDIKEKDTPPYSKVLVKGVLPLLGSRQFVLFADDFARFLKKVWQNEAIMSSIIRQIVSLIPSCGGCIKQASLIRILAIVADLLGPQKALEVCPSLFVSLGSLLTSPASCVTDAVLGLWVSNPAFNFLIANAEEAIAAMYPRAVMVARTHYSCCTRGKAIDAISTMRAINPSALEANPSEYLEAAFGVRTDERRISGWSVIAAAAAAACGRDSEREVEKVKAEIAITAQKTPRRFSDRCVSNKAGIGLTLAVKWRSSSVFNG